jgi:hypothetical protein
MCAVAGRKGSDHIAGGERVLIFALHCSYFDAKNAVCLTYFGGCDFFWFRFFAE